MAILSAEGVLLGLTAEDKTDAIRQCGDALVALGAATQEYADALHERELQVSTYIGEGVAIPHGTNESRAHITRPAIAFLQFPEGVDWGGHDVRVCIAIASTTEEHVGILQSLATVLMDSASAARLRGAESADEVLALLAVAD